MALTRGQLLDKMAFITGDDSTEFRNQMALSLNQMLFALWDTHDWNWKHKSGTFNTVAFTESYDLSVSSSDIRSSTDIEVLYDKTNGRFLKPADLREFRKNYPKEDNTNQPTHFAPWGSKTIFLCPNPNGIYQMKYLYLSKPTLPTADGDDLESVCGVPDYCHYVLEKMLTAEAFLGYDDSRRTQILEETRQIWLPNAIQADMRHLESGARFKFWEEEIAPAGNLSYDDFIAKSIFS